MARKFDYPIRMCIICKNRFSKSSLFRYQIKEGKIISFSNYGRSFYICEACLHGDEKKLQKILNSKCNFYIENCSEILKEIVANG